MRIVGDVNLVNATNNKKFEVPVDIYFYSPYGKEYDFVARNVGLRIQGTSSTTYPRKNYRLYFLRLENTVPRWKLTAWMCRLLNTVSNREHGRSVYSV